LSAREIMEDLARECALTGRYPVAIQLFYVGGMTRLLTLPPEPKPALHPQRATPTPVKQEADEPPMSDQEIGERIKAARP
jgi:hypothetical protein